MNDETCKCDICLKYNTEFVGVTVPVGDIQMYYTVCETCYAYMNDGMELETAKQLAAEY